jgi:ubiquinone/menaquinone biosynthesis C-methylase UbiE
MVRDPDEAYYAEQYLRWIVADAAECLGDGRGRVLDLGCGQGRLSIGLATRVSGTTIVGIDAIPEAIVEARKNAERLELHGVSFEVGEIAEYLSRVPSESFDLVLMIEVAFLYPLYREALAEAHRVLRPGGVLAASFRSRYYNVLHFTRLRAWPELDLVRTSSAARIGGTWLSWHTAAAVRSLFEKYGYSRPRLRGVGICSGIEGDPLEVIARPSLLWADEQIKLASMEGELAEDYCDCGRYILATAVRSKETP